MKHKFKIDINRYGSVDEYPFALYYWKSHIYNRWFFAKDYGDWEHLKSCKTREEAKAYHEKIKDLPEYL